MSNSKVVIIFRSISALNVFPNDSAFVNFLKKIPGVNRVISRDVNSLIDMINQFYELDLKQGTIVQFIIQAHGSPTSIDIGKDNICIGSPLWYEFVEFMMYCMTPFLITTGTIFLHSCSVGRDPIGEKVLPDFYQKLCRIMSFLVQMVMYQWET